MGTPYIGEIRMFGGSFAPVGWAFCNGALIPISENDALFTLIGTIYGGDGQETFALPNLMGRIPLHMGSLAGVPYTIGEAAGVESVTLTVQQIPVHSHAILCDQNNGTSSNPSNNMIAGSPLNPYVQAAPDTTMGPQMIGSAGGSQPHDNMMPYLCVTFIISLYGVFPTMN
jgi:microcystin-dependent protein